MTPSPSRRRRLLATAAGVGTGTVAFLLTLLDYGTDVTRQAHPLGFASNFFDVQARALLDGHLWVDSGALGIEAFVQDGRSYMYFGPFPALVRLPALLITDQYDGQLTLLSMALAFLVLAVVATRLVWLVRDSVRGDAEVTRFEAVMTGLLLASVTGGTVLTFNASLPWAYHEVYAWSVPLVLGSMYWMVRVQADPSRTALGWLFAFATATILTRTTGGWAVCLTTIGLGLWLLLRDYRSVATGSQSPRPVSARRALVIVGVGAVALAIGICWNWLKFRHAYLFPLEDQVWTTVSARRREALEVNGGTITGPQFFWTSLVNYFRPDGIRFVDYFPWVTLPAQPAPPYAGAFLDQSYRTGSVTSFMPGLLLMTAGSLLVLLRPGANAAVRLLRAPMVAAILTTGGVMAYGYLATRYTAEFVPALVLGAAVGTSGLVGVVERRAPVLRPVLVAVTSVVVGAGIVAQMLVGYSTAAVLAGGDELGRYLDLQRRLSPEAQARLVVESDGLPGRGRTDEVYIQGDCDAFFVNTGEHNEEWVLAGRRSVVIRATFDPDFSAALASVATIGAEGEQRVWLQTDPRGNARIVMRLSSGTQTGPWFEVLPPYRLAIGIRDVSGFGFAEVSSTPGGFVGYAHTVERAADDRAEPVPIEAALGDAEFLALRGIRLREERGLDPEGCGALRAGAASARSAMSPAP